ncbi:MAG: peptidoglycan-binding protein [Desertifilum sp.]|nr:peptidoglycan-binding protein [Desertifilum sp.]
MDFLAYTYSALAYEDPSVSTVQLNWKLFSHKIALWLLSVLSAIAIGEVYRPAFAQVIYRTLQFGQSGTDVELVQLCLLELGYFGGPVTGRFEASTRDAVRNFKFANRDQLLVPPNEVVEPETAAFLFRGCPQLTAFDRNLVNPTPQPIVPPPPPGFTGSFGNELRFGNQGPEVTRLQTLLNNAGFSAGGIDGIFGQNTQAALLNFQRAFGLSQTGVYDFPTQQVLERGTAASPASPVTTTRPLRRGDNNQEVRNLQSLLEQASRRFGNPRFDPGGIDGDFGPRTEEAVRQYQLAFGIRPADGVARSDTFARLRGQDENTAERPARGPQRYVVVVPGRSTDRLLRVREVFQGARVFADRRGSYVYAGGYQNRNEAESMSFSLKARGLDARVDFMPDPVLGLLN